MGGIYGEGLGSSYYDYKNVSSRYDRRDGRNQAIEVCQEMVKKCRSKAAKNALLRAIKKIKEL